MEAKSNRPMRIAGAVASGFGLLTIFSGGTAIFGGEAVQKAAGDAVPWVLWFNFLAGFAYVAAGIGLILRRRWGLWLSAAIFAATALVLLAFGIHVIQGGAYEMRTAGALVLRAGVWAAITAVAAKALRQVSPS